MLLVNLSKNFFPRPMPSGWPPSLIVWDCKSIAFFFTTKTFSTFFSKKLCLFYNLLITKVLQTHFLSFSPHFLSKNTPKNHFWTALGRHFFLSFFAKMIKTGINPFFQTSQIGNKNSVQVEKKCLYLLIYIIEAHQSRTSIMNGYLNF